MKEFHPIISDFQRSRKWWRIFNPKNMIGSFNGYATCDCGNTLWRTTGDFMTSYHGGQCICDACYKKFEKEIKLSNHYLMMQPNWTGVLCCYDKDCELHKEDSRFYWAYDPDHKDYWRLKLPEWEKLRKK